MLWPRELNRIRVHVCFCLRQNKHIGETELKTIAWEMPVEIERSVQFHSLQLATGGNHHFVDRDPFPVPRCEIFFRSVWRLNCTDLLPPNENGRPSFQLFLNSKFITFPYTSFMFKIFCILLPFTASEAPVSHTIEAHAPTQLYSHSCPTIRSFSFILLLSFITYYYLFVIVLFFFVFSFNSLI